jgi:hypothetical protein
LGWELEEGLGVAKVRDWVLSWENKVEERKMSLLVVLWFWGREGQSFVHRNERLE